MIFLRISLVLKLFEKFFLIFIIFSGLNCDPGWHYVLKTSYPERSYNEMTIRKDAIDIYVTDAYFFGGNVVQLKIKTNKDNTKIFPNFAYAKSLKNVNNIHIPDKVQLVLIQNGQEKLKYTYDIFQVKGNHRNDTNTNELIAWEKGFFEIKESAQSAWSNRGDKITIENFNSHLIINKGDKVTVKLRFSSFESCTGGFYPKPECQNFIMFYDLLKDNSPFNFEFIYDNENGFYTNSYYTNFFHANYENVIFNDFIKIVLKDKRIILEKSFKIIDQKGKEIPFSLKIKSNPTKTIALVLNEDLESYTPFVLLIKKNIIDPKITDESYYEFDMNAGSKSNIGLGGHYGYLE